MRRVNSRRHSARTALPPCLVEDEPGPALARGRSWQTRCAAAWASLGHRVPRPSSALLLHTAPEPGPAGLRAPRTDLGLEIR